MKLRIATVLLCAVHATCFGQSLSIFGFDLGGPLVLPECPYRSQTNTRPALGIQFIDSETPVAESAPAAIQTQFAIWKNSVRDKDVLVMKVTPLSVAEKAGLQVGDVISDMGGTPVRKIADVAAFMSKINPSAKVGLILKKRPQQTNQIVFLAVAELTQIG